MWVGESFDKRHADMLVWRIEHKLNTPYHIGHIPIVASLVFLV
jgi:hypothetical protein